MTLQKIHTIAKESQSKARILSMLVSAHESRSHYAGRVMSSAFGNRSLPPSEIRAMQWQRGEEPCFSTDKRYNCPKPCELRKECLKLRAVWLR